MSKSRRRPVPLVAVVLILFPALAWAAAARVDFAVGDVIVVAATGQQRPLRNDGGVEAGGFEGRTHGSERGFFSLVQRGMRMITGMVGHSNRGEHQVQTRVATMGIR